MLLFGPQIVFCTDDMIKRSLWEAVTTKQPDLKRVKVSGVSIPHSGSFVLFLT